MIFNICSGKCKKEFEANNFADAAEKFFHSSNYDDLTEVILVSDDGSDPVVKFFATQNFYNKLPKFKLVVGM